MNHNQPLTPESIEKLSTEIGQQPELVTLCERERIPCMTMLAKQALGFAADYDVADMPEHVAAGIKPQARRQDYLSLLKAIRTTLNQQTFKENTTMENLDTAARQLEAGTMSPAQLDSLLSRGCKVVFGAKLVQVVALQESPPDTIVEQPWQPSNA